MCRRVGGLWVVQEALTDLKRVWIPPISILFTLMGPFHELKLPTHPPSAVLGMDEPSGKCLQMLCLVSIRVRKLKKLLSTFDK